MNTVMVLLAGAVCVGIGVVIVILRVTNHRDPQAEALRARIAAERKVLTSVASEHTSGPSPVIALRDRAVSVADSVASARGWDAKLVDALSAAAIAMTPGQFLATQAATTAGLGLVMFLLSSGSPIALVLGLAVGFAGPRVMLRIRKSRRQNAYYSAIPDMLEGWAAAIISGNATPVALQMAARETIGPLADEISRVLVEERLGTSLTAALRDSSNRMNSVEMQRVVIALEIQSEVGGNLAEQLRRVAGDIRERERLRRHVAALSAEGRLSVFILGALPVVVALAMSVINPEYLAQLFGSVLGLLMLGVSSVLLFLGIVWARATTKVEY